MTLIGIGGSEKKHLKFGCRVRPTIMTYELVLTILCLSQSDFANDLPTRLAFRGTRKVFIWKTVWNNLIDFISKL